MNLVERIHGHSHKQTDAYQHSAPFWVRHYDNLVRFVALGRVEKLHGGTFQLTQLQPGQSILDIGCGTGDFILLAEKQLNGQGSFVGLDVECGMVEQAKSKAAKRGSTAAFAEAGIESIPYPDQSFDVVTSSLMLHHLTAKQQEAGLLELNRVLKSGGRIVIVDINTARRSLVSRFPGHRHLEQGDSVQEQVPAQLRAVGFGEIETGQHAFKALSYASGAKA